MSPLRWGIALFTLFGLLLSCDSPRKVTQMLVVIDSDRTDLDRVRVRVFDHDGKQSAPSSVQDFRITTVPKAGLQTLPLSFALLPEDVGDAPTFRLVVTGYRGDTEIEQQVGATFQSERSLRLEVFLMSWCDNVVCDRPIRELGHYTCTPATGGCGPYPDNLELPEIVRDEPLGGYSVKRPTRPTGIDERPESEIQAALGCQRCGEDYPCLKTLDSEFTCLGKWADWRMPDATPEAYFAPRYDTTIPDVVLDFVTDLYWQAELPDTYPDYCTGQIEHPHDACTQAQAKTYCDSLTLAKEKWRLPSAIELQSLFDAFNPPNYLSASAFPNSVPGSVWTKSPMAGADKPSWWHVDFSDDRTVTVDVARVRCVSSGALTINTKPHYSVDADNGLVTDQHTKLVWQQKQSADTLDWKAAAASCAELEGEGWRLPALNELMTLVDISSHDPAIDAAFEDATAASFWTATQTPDADRAWIVDFRDGAYARASIGQHLAVRCVRNGDDSFN